MKPSLTKITDLKPNDIKGIIDQAFYFQTLQQKNKPLPQFLKGKVVAMIFEKPSLRTKVAFEVATAKLGGIPIFLTSSQILASGSNEQGRESIPDIAKNLERYADLILARVYHHEVVQEIAKAIKKPVINALCDQHHPTQALADLMAIQWHKGKLPGLKVAFIGDGNNVATSLMQICALMGIHFAIASPKGYELPKVVQEELGFFTQDPELAVKNADVVYTDTFVSMGDEAEKNERLKIFQSYQVNTTLLKKAKKDAIFMHCLPAHRNEEVTDAVMDCPQSVIFDQAECRLHIALSLLTFYLSP